MSTGVCCGSVAAALVARTSPAHRLRERAARVQNVSEEHVTVQPTIAVYLEVGSRRVFAGALDWPGWCRSGRDEDGALAAVVAYGSRYRAAMGSAAAGLSVPTNASALEVVERLTGTVGTDFGVPTVAPSGDERPVDDAGLERLVRILEASWAAFEAAASAASGVVLRKGPRGGGRELDAIVAHVLEADRAYLASLGGTYRKPADADPAAEAPHLRRAIVETLSSRTHGEPLPPTRRSSPVWSPRYLVRRSAWHVLDHAWEIEDRATPPGDTSA